MSIAWLLDLAIAGIVLFFVLSGMKEGFVRSLCSLLSLVVAFYSALFLSTYLAPVAATIAEPYALPAIVEKLEGDTPSRDFESQTASALLENLHLPKSWIGIIERNYESNDTEAQPFTSPSELLAGYILRILCYIALFIVSFFLVLLLWAVITKTLDLVAKLPVLHVCNRTLGAILGAIKALLCLLLLRWFFCDITGLLSVELVANTWLFRWLSDFLEGTRLYRLLLSNHNLLPI